MPDQSLILSRGMTIVPVGNLQEQLSLVGFPLMLVDNIFGDKTEAAVRQFQASAGLEPTGVVNGETWRRLFDGEPLPAEFLGTGEESRKEETNSPELYIRIVLSLRRLLLFEDDNLVANYPVAIGKPTTPTPAGEFIILEKQLNPGGVLVPAGWLLPKDAMVFTVQINRIRLVMPYQTAVSACSMRMWKSFLTGSLSAPGYLLRPAR